MTDKTIVQIQDNLQDLRQLLQRFDSTVDQQQQTLVARRSDLLQQQTAQTSDELSRLLIFMHRTLHDLEQRIEAQKKEQAQLKALQEIGAVINSSLDLNQVLNSVMDAIIDLTQAERAILLLRNDETGELEVQAARNMDRETIERAQSFEISRSIVYSVAETGEPVVTTNAQADPRFSSQDSIISYNLRSILCVPLKIKESITGVVYADNRVASGIFVDADRDVLAALANQAAVAIENARLFREIRNHLAEITEIKELKDNVFASIASGVITIDDQDRVALINQAAEHILGLPPETILQQTYHNLLAALSMPVAPIIEDVRGKGGIQNAELDIAVPRRAGLITLNVTVSPLRDTEQSAFGVAMVLDDVSEKKRLESVRRYLPPALVDQVRDLDAAQRPQRRDITVLFADVRGFSTVSEQLDPEKLIQIINGYFTEAVQAITQYEGLTDKFMGDAVMALFNTPLNPQEHHAERAVRTALMIQARMATYHADLPQRRQLHFGIGIHTGEAVVGNVGSHLRKDYSAIGDAVNLAKRLQENAAPDQIIVSQAVYDAVKDLVVAEALNPMRVKGRQALEQVYLLQGLAERA
ncbi:MAG: adenylate/guanylate cyclase domain-containing protein [Chloroflexota bacterium]